jgi:branched-chain amino acid transport system permease protein
MDLIGVLQNALRAAFGPDAAVFALAAVGLNVHYGYTGLRNFGLVGFMLVGAYGLGITVATWQASWLLGIAFGLFLSVVLALLLGIPTLRLRTDYFAIVTIAAGEILRLVVRSGSATDVTGGPFGLQSISGDFFALNPFPNRRFGTGQLSYSSNDLWSLTVTWGLVALATFVVILLIKSPWGRVIKSIREDEDVARALGKNVFGYKLQSLVLGGVLAGLAGIMLALSNSTVNANTYQPQQTFYAFAILILGGAGTRFGPVLGSMIFWFLFAGSQSLLAQMASEDLLPGVLQGSQSQGALSVMLVGIGLVVLMAFRPQGIFGDPEEMALDE